MKIYRYKPGVCLEGLSTVALGFFDGVHEGHRRLLETARRTAKERGLCFTVFTFVSEGGVKDGTLIYSTEQKMDILRELGVEAVALADFKDISHLSADEFIESCLYRDMGCRVAVAGYDFRFGKGREGNFEKLRDSLTRLGAECVIEDEHRIDGEKISSTKIKELLSEGKVDKARLFLGAPYRIRGVVERGRGVGKTLGFPTVNIKIPGESAPLLKGVYRTAVDISGTLYTGITNVGTCPTFKERELHSETYIADCRDVLYGREITIFFLGFLRQERKFSSPDELIMQINVDKNTAIKENGDLTWQEIGQS